MTAIIQPNQPFVVRRIPALSPHQGRILLRFYQPILGSQALALYLTLNQLNPQATQWSRRWVHAQLLTILDLGIQDLDQGRKKLEGVGLLKTYRQQDPDLAPSQQLLVYALQPPLEVGDFLENPLLASALAHKLGSDSLEDLVGEFRQDPVPADQFKEVSSQFDQVFGMTSHRISPPPSGNFVRQKGQSDRTSSAGDLDPDLLEEALRAKGLPDRELTQALYHRLQALATVYSLDIYELAHVTYLASHHETGRVQYDRLDEIVQKQGHVAQAGKSSGAQPPQRAQEELDSDRAQKIQEAYPQLNQDHIQLILLCDQMTPTIFNRFIKSKIGGFATDNETYYLEDLARRTHLSDSVINYLIYHLLVILDRPNLYKSDLQRLANEWQQLGLETVGEVMVHMLNQQKIQAVKDKPRKQRQYSPKRTPYYEVEPAWMQGPSHDRSYKESSLSDEELEQRLKSLLEGESSDEIH